MNLHSLSSRPSIIPSSRSIHTINSEQGGRTFYYSSLIIDHDSRNFGSQFRWKVHLGDIVAVAKNNSKKEVRDLIKTWKPNHHVKKSTNWKVGLVVALRKRITRHTPTSHGFECHIQWLDKAMDLDKDEMKTSLKGYFRPYTAKSKQTGSQLPHILINREGDYGIVSMLPTTRSIDSEYNILLPVRIKMKTKQDFMSNGVKEGEESQYALQFCCLNRRIKIQRSSENEEEQSIVLSKSKIVPEPDPDAWVQFNPPCVKENERSNNEAKNPALLNKIPEPLQQAWKGWIQASCDIDCGGVGTPSTLSSENKEIVLQQNSLLGDALMRGWSQSRRERYKEEQRGEEIIEEGTGAKRINDTTKISTETLTTNSKKKKKSSSHNSVVKTGPPVIKGVAIKKRKKNDYHDDTDIFDQTTNISKRKKKELRFSADTKQPSSLRIFNVSQKPSKPKKPLNMKAPSRRQPSTTTMSRKEKANITKNSNVTKNGRQTNTKGNNDSEMASITTIETHSTDTTLSTRGAGRKFQGKILTATVGTCYKKNRNDGNCESDDIKLPNLADALDKWKVDSGFMQQTRPFYTKNRKDYFKELRMTIPSGDPAIGSLLDKDGIGSLGHYRHGNDQYLSFQINIGSVVAIHYEGSVSTTNSWAPFLVPFGFAQVTNIFRVRSDDEDDDLWKLSIKWFYRYPELSDDRRTNVLTSMNKKDGLVETYESCDCFVKEVLPANIELTSDSAIFASLPRQTQGSDGFPIVRMLCQHLERSRTKISMIHDWRYSFRRFLQSLLPPFKESFPGPLKRAVDKMSKLVKPMYISWLTNNTCTDKTKTPPNRITTSFNPLDASHYDRNPGEAWCRNKPFRVDSSELKAFYAEMTMIPQCKINTGNGKYKQTLTPKTLRMGDIIHVRFEGPKRPPYDCNWALAEVVAIFKEFVSQNELERELKLDLSEHREHKVRVETRLFYERKDMSMVALSTEEETELTEVFETDVTQVMEDAGAAILGHAKLVENSTDMKRDDNEHPTIQQFFCTRFWSTKRRSLIPCGGAIGRKKRGLIHSKYLNKSLLSRNILTEYDSISPNWKNSMINLIGNLTLKESGKALLVGRENEISNLLTFFRAAFREDPTNESFKSSLFLAGPPGVGKTASVRAAIANLQREQEVGLVPKFRFISLNGIEVRHPFDVYIRFWEALTGKKHVGPQERACEWLEAYFTSESFEQDSTDSNIIIVLLDEIDYLVTNCQSVLYNFFDWPKRAAEVSNGRRLVVVGISNTLNLVDQLMPSVQSRIGTEKYVFKAYSLHDTVSILKSKINEGSPDYIFFEDDAILFAAKKTAALSGDIRKAFQICRSAAELVTQKFEDNTVIDKERGPFLYPRIRIGDVQKASMDSFNIALTAAVSFSTSYEVLLLVSLADLSRATGRDIGGFDIKDILAKMEALAAAAGDPQYLPPPSFGESIRILTRLGEMNLVELKTKKSSSVTFRQSHGGSGGAWPMTSLAIDELTLLKGLKSTTHRTLAQKSLPSLF